MSESPSEAPPGSALGRAMSAVPNVCEISPPSPATVTTQGGKLSTPLDDPTAKPSLKNLMRQLVCRTVTWEHDAHPAPTLQGATAAGSGGTAAQEQHQSTEDDECGLELSFPVLAEKEDSTAASSPDDDSMQASPRASRRRQLSARGAAAAAAAAAAAVAGAAGGAIVGAATEERRRRSQRSGGGAAAVAAASGAAAAAAEEDARSPLTAGAPVPPAAAATAEGPVLRKRETKRPLSAQQPAQDLKSRPRKRKAPTAAGDARPAGVAVDAAAFLQSSSDDDPASSTGERSFFGGAAAGKPLDLSEPPMDMSAGVANKRLPRVRPLISHCSTARRRSCPSRPAVSLHRISFQGSSRGYPLKECHPLFIPPFPPPAQDPRGLAGAEDGFPCG